MGLCVFSRKGRFPVMAFTFAAPKLNFFFPGLAAATCRVETGVAALLRGGLLGGDAGVSGTEADTDGSSLGTPAAAFAAVAAAARFSAVCASQGGNGADRGLLLAGFCCPLLAGFPCPLLLGVPSSGAAAGPGGVAASAVLG